MGAVLRLQTGPYHPGWGMGGGAQLCVMGWVVMHLLVQLANYPSALPFICHRTVWESSDSPCPPAQHLILSLECSMMRSEPQ